MPYLEIINGKVRCPDNGMMIKTNECTKCNRCVFGEFNPDENKKYIFCACAHKRAEVV